MKGPVCMGILILTAVGGLALGCEPGMPATLTPGASVPTTTPAPPTVPAAGSPTLPVPPARPTLSPTHPAGTPEPTFPPPVIPPEAQKPVELARADLARRLGLKTEEAIGVASVEAVDWPDTSLGCPEPGMMYAQMITPGYRMILVAGGQPYEYHTDRGTQAVLCENGTRAGAIPAPTADLADPAAQRAAEAARSDLARRLNLDPATIAVVQVTEQDFPAQNLGCPPPSGTEPGPVQPAFVTGLEIVLAAGESEYVYRAHGGTVVFCGPR